MLQDSRLSALVRKGNSHSTGVPRSRDGCVARSASENETETLCNLRSIQSNPVATLTC